MTRVLVGELVKFTDGSFLPLITDQPSYEEIWAGPRYAGNDEQAARDELAAACRARGMVEDSFGEWSREV